MTLAPLPIKYWMVGRAATIRVSSVMTPFFSGTLKSHRTSTRLPATSKSSTVFLFNFAMVKTSFPEISVAPKTARRSRPFFNSFIIMQVFPFCKRKSAIAPMFPIRSAAGGKDGKFGERFGGRGGDNAFPLRGEVNEWDKAFPLRGRWASVACSDEVGPISNDFL